MLEEISSQQFLEWVAYSQIEPFDEERGDVRAAVIASTVANCHRSSKSKPFTISDFMPFAEKPERQPQPIADQMAIARCMTLVGYKA